jgi:hypothetical protein
MKTLDQAFTGMICATIAILSAGVSAAQDVDLVKVDQPRPLMALSAKLVQDYGYLVTYEDAPPLPQEVISERRANGREYRRPAFKPVTFQVLRRNVHRSGTAALRGQGLSAANAGPDVMDPILREYAASGNTGQFTVVYEGDYAHVIPAGRGGEREFAPLLDTVVSVPQEGGTCWSLLTNLLSEVQQKRGVRITIAAAPVSPMDTKACAVRSHDVPARRILVQLLDQLGDHTGTAFPNDRFAWTLVYEPTTEAYFLSTQLAPNREERSEKLSERPQGQEVPTATPNRIMSPPKK